eukprot:UN09465
MSRLLNSLSHYVHFAPFSYKVLKMLLKNTPFQTQQNRLMLEKTGYILSHIEVLQKLLTIT